MKFLNYLKLIPFDSKDKLFQLFATGISLPRPASGVLHDLFWVRIIQKKPEITPKSLNQAEYPKTWWLLP